MMRTRLPDEARCPSESRHFGRACVSNSANQSPRFRKMELAMLLDGRCAREGAPPRPCDYGKNQLNELLPTKYDYDAKGASSKKSSRDGGP